MIHPTWPSLTMFEQLYWCQGLIVAGTDEVGRGPLAGPVVAAAVIFDPETPALEGLDDSKRLSQRQRESLYVLIQQRAQAIGVGACGPRTIERLNIYQAARLAMRRAIQNLGIMPDVVLTDAMPLPDAPHYTVSLVHGDSRSASIAAASIVAKVVRDRYMDQLHESFPQYHFDQHKGYATRAHREALARYGPSAAHRATFLHDSEEVSAQ
ncbi:ribonuclease HII [Sulfobacillus harzensis]|uniref:Ribonuclease HII n=1 Tax=Sulfobacillus harzensis TaxID=2729629 RepID=A0A7Y0L799_9FIRM|nr:ribonuclease HII [Sulfobacillus harzensis]NMP24612.1 ribonuclease HII [Sulfobacillus harzensis]